MTFKSLNDFLKVGISGFRIYLIASKIAFSNTPVVLACGSNFCC